MSYIGNEPIVSATRTVTEITATAGQTVFTANGGYTVGFIDVFVNGSQLTASDFTATDGSTITLTEAAAVNDIVRLVAWGTFSTSTSVQKSGDTMTGNLTISPTTNTNSVWLNTSNGGGGFFVGRDNSTGSGFAFQPYASLLWSQGARPMLFATNDTVRMTLDSNGNLGVGTTSTLGNSLLNVALGITARNQSTTTPYFQLYNANAGTNLKTWRWGNDNSGNMFFQTVDDAYSAAATRMLVDANGVLQFNSGYGSVAAAYGCRAWVNFNGSGGVSIRGSGNVSSVTRSGGGIYFVTFTNSMPDVNFCFNGSASVSSGNFGLVPGDEISSRTVSRTGTFYTVNAASVNNAADANNINITIFR